MKPFLMAAIVIGSASKALAMDSLSDLEWKNRIVVILGDSNDSRVVRQSEILTREEAALADRDMVIIQVSEKNAITLFGPSSDRDARAIRKDLAVRDAGFRVVLVGKDGTVKLRRDEVVSDTEIFGLIDTMPMRRAEQKG